MGSSIRSVFVRNGFEEEYRHMNTAPIVSKVCPTSFPSREGWPEGPGWVPSPGSWLRSWGEQPTPPLTRHPS